MDVLGHYAIVLRRYRGIEFVRLVCPQLPSLASPSYSPSSLCVRVARSDWRSFAIEIHRVNTAREEDAGPSSSSPSRYLKIGIYDLPSEGSEERRATAKPSIGATASGQSYQQGQLPARKGGTCGHCARMSYCMRAATLVARTVDRRQDGRLRPTAPPLPKGDGGGDGGGQLEGGKRGYVFTMDVSTPWNLRNFK
ncbi:hypothetical protein BHM03_00061428, partial [Ensete ventricosum]